MAMQSAYQEIDFPQIMIDSNKDAWPDVRSPAFKANNSPSLRWMSHNCEMQTMAKTEERIKTIQDRYSAYVKITAKRNRKNEESSPKGNRGCITSMGEAIKECKPNLELEELDISRAPSAIGQLNKGPMQKLVADGRQKMDKRMNTTPKTQRKNAPSKLSVTIPNKITLQPRINRGTYRTTGKSLEMTGNRRLNSPCRDLNWGKLPAGGPAGGLEGGGVRYYRPTYDESVLMDSLRGYFTNSNFKEDMAPISRVSRYSE